MIPPSSLFRSTRDEDSWKDSLNVPEHSLNISGIERCLIAHFLLTVRRYSKFLENSFSFSFATREKMDKFLFENNVEWHLFSINRERQNDRFFSFLTKKRTERSLRCIFLLHTDRSSWRNFPFVFYLSFDRSIHIET